MASQDAPKTELSGHFGGNDGLASWFGEGALDAMEGERRVAHAAHDHRFFVI